MHMKKISENKKIWIAATIILLVVIALIIGISVKSCSQKPGNSKGNIGTEQGKENRTDTTGKDSKDDSKTPAQEEENDGEGLTVVDPKNEKTENNIDASGSWEESSKPDEDNILKDDKKWGNIF